MSVSVDRNAWRRARSDRLAKYEKHDPKSAIRAGIVDLVL